MFEKAREASNDAFLVGTVARSVFGDRRKVGGFAADKTTDQGNQCVEMFFAMALRARLVELHDRLFYGTISTMRVIHGVLPPCGEKTVCKEKDTMLGSHHSVEHIFCPVVKPTVRASTRRSWVC
jgi:hypothetical protein